MDTKTYQKEAIRTDIEDYSAVQKRLLENKTALQSAVNGFMLSSSAMDLMKKKVMYDADKLKMLKLDAELSKTLAEFPADLVEQVAKNELYSQLFHYTIGIITEANEMMVALANGVKTGSLDLTNVGEELSDTSWYSALMCERLGLDMGNLMEKNISKLKQRFPEKFTNEAATNRDLTKERAILEGGV